MLVVEVRLRWGVQRKCVCNRSFSCVDIFLFRIFIHRMLCTRFQLSEDIYVTFRSLMSVSLSRFLLSQTCQGSCIHSTCIFGLLAKIFALHAATRINLSFFSASCPLVSWDDWTKYYCKPRGSKSASVIISSIQLLS